MLDSTSVIKQQLTISQEKKYRIPPFIHFVWAGGNKLPGNDDFAVLKEWIIINPDCQVRLWVDPLTYSAGKENLYNDYKKLLGDDFNLCGLGKQENNLHKPTLNLSDIVDDAFRDEIVAYEIEQLDPNYGSSSDTLRYRIVYKYGGAHFDLDVARGATRLVDGGVFEPNKEHVLYVEHLPQRTIKRGEITKKQLENFTIDELGNDAFIATPNNPAIGAILNQVKRNYNLSGISGRSIEIGHGSRTNIDQITINRTGPGVVQEIIQKAVSDTVVDENGYLYTLKLKPPVRIKRLRDGAIELIEPQRNTANWLKVPTTKHENTQTAVEAIIKTIQFEAIHFKVFRFDDHIEVLMRSTKIDRDEATELLKTAVKNIPNFQAKNLFGQLTFTNGLVTEEFYKEIGLQCHIAYFFNEKNISLEQIERFKSCIEVVLDNELSQNKRQTFENDFIKFADISDEMLDDDIKHIENHLYKIELGIEFIYNLLHFSSIKNNETEVARYCFDEIKEALGFYEYAIAKVSEANPHNLQKLDQNALDNIIKKCESCKTYINELSVNDEYIGQQTIAQTMNKR